MAGQGTGGARLALGAEEDVVALDVAVDPAPRVQEAQRLRHLRPPPHQPHPCLGACAGSTAPPSPAPTPSNPASGGDAARRLQAAPCPPRARRQGPPAGPRLSPQTAPRLLPPILSGSHGRRGACHKPLTLPPLPPPPRAPGPAAQGGRGLCGTKGRRLPATRGEEGPS